MSETTDAQLHERWKDEPAPLLPLLHALHDRDGYLSEEALRGVAARPPHSHRGPLRHGHLLPPLRPRAGWARRTACLHGPGVQAARVGRVCSRPWTGRDPDALLRALRRADPGAAGGRHAGRGSAHPPSSSAPPSSRPRRFRGSRSAYSRKFVPRGGRRSTATGRTGGYEALARAVREGREALLTAVDASGLAGRGGAGFPTGRKWRAVAEAPGTPKTIVCNADEGEPGCFKDRGLLDHDPHAILEGMIHRRPTPPVPRAASSTCATSTRRPEQVLERAIAEARAAGFLGPDILGTGLQFRALRAARRGRLHLRRGDSLLNSLEGKHPFPRNRPPFPVTHGFEDLPTVVNNVETLALRPAHRASRCRLVPRASAAASTRAPSSSASRATSRDPATTRSRSASRSWTLLHDWAGGPGEGRTVQAVTMAGLSGGFLGGADLDVTLDEPCVRVQGLVPRRGRDHGLRRHARHGRGRAAGDVVLRARVVRQVLPLPDRNPAADRAPGGRRRARRARPPGPTRCGTSAGP